MPSTPSASEQFEGFWDGRHYGSDRLLARVRRDLQRYELALDDDMRVCVAEPPFMPIPSPEEPDLLAASADYRDGWEAGIAWAESELTQTLRRALVAWDLYLSAQGRVATTDVVDELLAAMERWRAERDPRVPDDDEMHAFLDRYLSPSAPDAVAPSAKKNPPGSTPLDLADVWGYCDLGPSPDGKGAFTIPKESVASPDPLVDNKKASIMVANQDGQSRTAGRPRKSLLARVASMVMKRVTRRAAITTLCTVAVASGLGVGWRMLATKPAQKVASQAGQYVPPRYWDNYPAASRNYFMSLDSVVWFMEQLPGGVSQVQNGLVQIMSSPSQDELKNNLATFVTTSFRSAYVESLLYCLLPGASSGETRRVVLFNINEMVAESGTGSISANTRNSLLFYWTSGGETDAGARAELDVLLTQLGVPHS